MYVCMYIDKYRHVYIQIFSWALLWPTQSSPSSWIVCGIYLYLYLYLYLYIYTSIHKRDRDPYVCMYIWIDTDRVNPYIYTIFLDPSLAQSALLALLDRVLYLSISISLSIYHIYTCIHVYKIYRHTYVCMYGWIDTDRVHPYIYTHHFLGAFFGPAGFACPFGSCAAASLYLYLSIYLSVYLSIYN